MPHASAASAPRPVLLPPRARASSSRNPQLGRAGAGAAVVVEGGIPGRPPGRARIGGGEGGGGEPRPLPGGSKDEGGPRWSPDGRQPAFIATRGAEARDKPQLYIVA